MGNKLQRNQNDKMIAGVASGLAEHLDVDPVWVRLVFVLAVFAGLSGILIYIIMWIAIPAKPYVPFSNLETDYRVYDDKNDIILNKGESPPYRERERSQGNSSMIAGLILIFLGVFFLSDEFNLIPYWVSLDKLWPLALIIPGVFILAKARRKNNSGEGSDTIADNKQEDVVPVNTKNDKDDPL